MEEGLLVIYANNRQFDDVSDLEECIKYEWEKIGVPILQKLAESVVRRLTKVIEKKGGYTQ